MKDLSERLTPFAWRFSRGDGSIIAPVLTFRPRGIVGGYFNDNEWSWEMRNGCLAFLDSKDVTTTLFTEAYFDDVGPTRLVGTFLNDGQTIHILDRVALPSCVDLGTKSQQTVPNFVRKLGPLASHRRNLVVIRANELSLHETWTRNIPDSARNWDLCISWYGSAAPPMSLECEFLAVQPEDRKYGAIHALFLNGSPLWNYERYWLPDDDLMTSWADVNRLFSLARRHDLELAQPSLSSRGYITHAVTRHNPSFLLRNTNFVEPMCPLFSCEALNFCLPTMNGSIYGFGLDHVWSCLLGGGARGSKMAIIDDVVIEHTRPIGTNYDLRKATEEDISLRKLYGASVNFSDCGGLIRAS
jgi:hypothetical protein